MTTNQNYITGGVTDPHQPVSKCPNCTATLIGKFCHECGQRGHTHHKLIDLASELFEGLGHFDTKLWRTAPFLLTNPGYLASEWSAGRRVRYMAPLSTFLFAVFLLFMSITFSGHHLIEGGDFAALGETSSTAAKNPELYAYKIEGWAYKLSVLFVPFTVASLAVLFAFRKSVTVYQHVVVALYGLAFVALLSSVTLWLVDLFPGKTEYLLAVPGIAHAITLIRGAYGLTWLGAGMRGLALAVLSLLWLALYGWIVMQIGLGL